MTQPPYDPNQPPNTGQWQQPYPPHYPHGYGYPNPYGYPPQPPKSSGMSVAGMILGIVSLALCFLPIGLVPLITAIVGLPLAIIGGNQDRRTGAKTGMATAGIVCNAIAIVIAIIAIAVWAGDGYF